MRTVLGKVATRPGDAGFITLQRVDVSTATSLDVLFGAAQNQYRDLLVHLFNIEKPSVNNATYGIQVSTNGATFEGGAAYNYVYTNQSATSAQTATGTIGTTSFTLSVGTSPFALSTASGKGGADALIFIHHAGSGPVHISWDWHYQNSASSPVQGYGSGYFASGPCAGVSLLSGGSTFSGTAIVYGLSRIGP